MESVVSATEARIHFGELMRRVVEGQEAIIVERGGKPQVVVLSVAEYERLGDGQQRQPDWRTLLREAQEQIQAELAGRELRPSTEEVIRQMREERDAAIDAGVFGLH